MNLYTFNIWVFLLSPSLIYCDENFGECNENMTVSWWNLPPYVYKTNTNVDGILKTIVEKLVGDCCGELVGFTYLKPAKNSQEMKLGYNNSVLNFPVYAKRTVDTILGKPFVPVIESPGIIFITKLPEDGKSSKVVIESAIQGWPILMLGLLMTAIAGILMWMLDSYINYEEFPKSFFQGVWKGFWWAIVTMTTVGYGDKVPRSVVARTLAIIWVSIGLIIFALFSSAITSALTARSLETDVELYGKTIVVLNRTEEENFAIRRNARTNVANTIEEFADKILMVGNDGGLIDSYVAGFYKELFDEEKGYIVSEVFDYQFMYGLVLTNELENVNISSCISKTMNTEDKYITNLISENINSLPELNKDKIKELSTSVFSAKSKVFQEAAINCAVIVVILIICGAIWQFYYIPKSRRNDVKVNDVVDADVVLYESFDEMVKVQIQELEQAMVVEVLMYINAFKKRQEDLTILINNPILRKQLPGLMANDELRFAKYKP